MRVFFYCVERGEYMLPEKVTVAGIEYEIKEVDGLSDEHGLGGQILYEKGIIKIDSGMCHDKKEQILVHELLHSVFNEAGFENHEEDVVNRLAIVLYQVLKSNKLYFGNADTAERAG